MADIDRAQLLRIALAVHRQLERRRSVCYPSALPAVSFERCQRLLGFLQLAQVRQWQAAARTCRDRLRRALEDLRRQVEASLDEIRRLPSSPSVSARDLYEELLALNTEFDDVRIDLKERIISAVTDVVELDGVALGRFEILLDWERLGDGSACYEVIASDPNPAAADSSVTHPHVRDGQLCEGSAWGAVRAALGSGRLLDFFTVVAQTLATYNGESAYVSLDLWAGLACADCGFTSGDDDRTVCEGCECDLCSDCGASCADCDRTNCSECSRSCAACAQSFCGPCLVSCASCDNDFCERCLSDGQCTKCRDVAAEEEARPPTEANWSATAALDAAADSLCMGQAPLPP